MRHVIMVCLSLVVGGLSCAHAAEPATREPYGIAPPARPFLDEVTTDPGRLRIAFTDRPLLGDHMDPDCVAALHDTVKLLESLGHTVVEASPPLARDEFLRAFLLMVCAQSAADLVDAESVTGRRASPSNVEISTWALALLGRSYSAGEMAHARRQLERASRAVGRWFDGYEIDVLVTPTLTTPPFIIGALQPPPSDVCADWLGAAVLGLDPDRDGEVARW